jgi:octaprenyl-diphosphate synthase
MNAEFEKGLLNITLSSSRLTGEIAGYILGSGGKRLRPKLVIMMGEAVGMDLEKIMPMAYSVEILHTASLLHDDVVDGTEIRRSKPTANQVYGDKPALLAGDFLSAMAMDIMFSLGNISLAQSIVSTIKKMAEGELKEIEHSASFHNNINVYLDIIYLKTASLFELCTVTPGIIAGLDSNRITALADFGKSIGMAFQIVDDIINVYPLKDDDKDACNDIFERKSTLPLIYLFNDRPDLISDLSSFDDPEKWRDMILPMLGSDILNRCKRTAVEYLDNAISVINQAGFLTDKMLKLPETILDPIESRL